jgi:uncharacterized protein YbjT (DUF2867 family)
VAALERPIAVGRSYQLAGPTAISLRDLILQASATLKRPTLRFPIPLPAIRAVARLYEATVPHPRFRVEQLARLAEDKAFDIGPARHDLGHSPRPFAQGIAEEAALLSRRAK